MFQETEEIISLHGLGFIQVKLDGKQRLHVWHPDLPRRKCFVHSQIHDHRFGFTSRVLVGTQVNRLYKIAPTLMPEKATHVAYKHEGERTRFGNRPWIPAGFIRVGTAFDEVIRAGDEYEMPPYRYHSTHPEDDGRVATIMQKTEEHELGAKSLCEIGIEPDVDFDRKQWPDDKLWAIVRDVLGKSNTFKVIYGGTL